MKQVEVTLKSGKAILVRRDEVPGLREAKVLDESKLSDELKKPLKKNGDGVKAVGKASVGIFGSVRKKPLVPIGYIRVDLKSGGTIKVKRHEVQGLVEAGVLKDNRAEKKAEAEKAKAEKEAKKLAEKEAKVKAKADKEAKEKEEKDKAKTKEEKDTGKTKDDSK